MVFCLAGAERINRLLSTRGIAMRVERGRSLKCIYRDWFTTDDPVPHDAWYDGAGQRIIISHDHDEFLATIFKDGEEFCCRIEVLMNGGPMGTQEWRTKWRKIVMPWSIRL